MGGMGGDASDELVDSRLIKTGMIFTYQAIQKLSVNEWLYGGQFSGNGGATKKDLFPGARKRPS